MPEIRKLILFFGVLILAFPQQIQAEEMVPAVIIEEGEDHSHHHPIDNYSIFKSESISKEKLKEPSRQTLADLVKDQVGVDTQVYCANCGAKRLTINGLKGEHTSILVDGIPLHSAISSFYGVDSVPVNGIEDIRVMRGAGASLTNPEAIGGTLNIISIDPLNARQVYSTSLNFNDEFSGTAQNHSALVSVPLSQKLGLSFGGQYTRSNPWDEDENNVAESPRRDTGSGLFKMRFLPNAKNDVSLRVGYTQLEILGGAMNAKKPSQVRPIPAQQTDFVNGSVHENFIGDPAKITDWIQLSRFETGLNWSHYLSQAMTLYYKAGYARQAQNSIYQHGFDYANIDNMFVNDLSLQWAAGESHIFTFGLFYKDQKMRSASAVLFGTKALPKDSFDNISLAHYAQYTWLLNDSIELDFAYRADYIDINWLSLPNSIQETVFAPRFQFRQNFTEHFSQRFSYGLGYRAPLTFFESQHGNEENGYQLNITELEKAHSLVYSLSYNTPNYYLTGGAHYTLLQNMAYGQEAQGQPIFYVNSLEDYQIWATDILAGYKILPWWMLEGSIEFFNYEDGYTRKLPTAAIEKRIQFKSSIETGSWRHTLLANIIGSRNLSRYGNYNDHFVDRKQFPTPEVQGTLRKRQKSPTFVTVDTSVNYNFKKNYNMTVGVNNLFDYTQAGRGDSPSTWHWHFDHGHYDGLHTWGPNRGREFYLQVSAEF